MSWRGSITQVIEENSRPLDGRERKKIEQEWFNECHSKEDMDTYLYGSNSNIPIEKIKG